MLLLFDDHSALSPFAKVSDSKSLTSTCFRRKNGRHQKVQDFIGYTRTIKDGQEVTVTILRDNAGKKEKMTLKGKAILDKMTMETPSFKAK